MTVLVTGSAGFIGYSLCEALLARGETVVGYDNFNAYYDPVLKEVRTQRLNSRDGFSLVRGDVADAEALEALFAAHKPDRVVHLAAQAGVRYSIENPQAYVTANLVGFCNMLETCKRHGVKHLVYASTSSVYGASDAVRFSEDQSTDQPLSIYAATKKSNEVLAHSYAHLFGMAMTGLRFFTVYGPWGRPDMALFKFTKAILAGEPIPVFNNGNHARDFTYIDDIVAGIVAVVDRPPETQPETPPYRIFNIGRGAPVDLMDFIGILERCLGRKAIVDFKPMQPGDVEKTWASTDALHALAGYEAKVSVEEGVARFVDWYREYYSVA
ncbi:MAG: SDR family NAD(P)-dependent oxidoreductase [Pseudomonadota bacterium]